MITLRIGQKMDDSRLTYIGEAGRIGVLRVCRFICECGNEIEKPLAWVRHKNTLSCGCLRKDLVAKKNLKHGGASRSHRSGAYRSWQAMNQRAGKVRGYEKVAICEQWRWPDGFPQFLRDMGERPRGLTLERRENDGHYEPSNCRWATYSDQNKNKRRKIK